MYCTKLRWRLGMSGVGFLVVFLIASPAIAQVTVGSETNLSMNAELGAGYAGAFGNQTLQSSHGLFFTGLGNLSGYYHNPKFLNFDVQPFYNRSQDNSSFQSVLSDSGVEASVSLFGGSHFPGSVSYGAGWQTGSQFQIAGQPGLSANGNTQTFAVTWSALVPKWPTLTATYSDSSSSQTILGDTGSTSLASRYLNILSNYQLYGFQINGFYNHQNVDSTFPEFVTGTSLQSSTKGNSYGVSASRAISLSGSVGVSVSRFNYNTDDNFGQNNDGTSDTAIASIGLNPTRRLGITGTVRYYDNLFGELQQNGTLPPGSVPLTHFGSNVSGLTMNTFASYNIGKGFVLVGYANRQMQKYAGTEYDSNQWGATLTYNYARPLFGLLYFSFGTVNTAGNGNQGYLGFVGNLGLKKKINSWEINADIAYAQNVQSSIALFTTSNYNYGGYVRKRFFDNTYFVASYQAIQTALTQLAGYNTRSETAIATLNRRWLGLSASYSQTNGRSILTSSGALVPTPVPLPGEDQVIYAGTAYGAGLGLTPVRRMVINVNWFRVHNETQGTFNSIFTNSDNDSDRVYAQLQYNVRKLIVRSTFWRVNQLISSSGLGRQTVNSYSFSISRWFNFF